MVDFIIILGLIAVIVLIIKLLSKIDDQKTEVQKMSSKLDYLYSMLKKLNDNAATKEDLTSIINQTMVDTDKVALPKVDPSISNTKIPKQEEDLTLVDKVDNMEDSLSYQKYGRPSDSSDEVVEHIKQNSIQEVAKTDKIDAPESILSLKKETQSVAPKGKAVIKGQTIHAKRKDTNTPNFFTSFFNENLLPKIGIITFVLGIAFFVKYAIDKDWINEIGRVGIGIATGALLAGIAHYLRNKYHTFSSLLMGGGIAIFYISITLAFQQYHLMSQTVAFVLTIVITLFAVAFSLLYDRQELAIVSLIGGFASPLLVSTGEGNYIVLFSYLFILNTGLLLISLRKKWNVIFILAFVLTWIFLWSWLLTKYSTEKLGAMIFASLFFAQFYAISLVRSLSQTETLRWLEIVVLIFNNLCMALSSLLILENSDFKGLVIITLAVINAIVMIMLYKTSRINTNFIYAILAIVISLVSLAIPIQLDGFLITMFWAIEIAVLTWMLCKTKIRVFDIGTYVVILLTIISYTMDVNYNSQIPIIFNKIFLAGVIVIASLLLTLFLLRQYGLRDKPKIKYYAIVVLSFIFTFIVPFLELNYQLDSVNYQTKCFILSIYYLVYLSCVSALFRKTITSVYFIILFVLLTLLSINYSIQVGSFEFYLYASDGSADSTALLANLHWLAFIAIVNIIFQLIRRLKYMKPSFINIFAYLITIVGIFDLSITTDSVALSIFSNGSNYLDLLSDCHTFVYPIVWGIVAFVIMILGIENKQNILRKLSLVFFGIIIAKFYIYDVWRMSQFGRILSFVVLGIILLLVSFLLQKIKNWIKDDNNKTDSNENK